MAASANNDQDVSLLYSRTVGLTEFKVYCDDSDESNDVTDEGNDVASDVTNDEDPFKHKVSFTVWQWIQIAFMSVTVAPIRGICVLFMFILASLFAFIGLIGVSETDLETRPLSGWRRRLQSYVMLLCRAGFFFMGVHWINEIGKNAPRSEAPVIVVAPHSTIMDTLCIVKTNAIPIAKGEIKKYPFIGQIAMFLQVLLVDRKDEGDRQAIREQIESRISRAPTSGNGSDWHQLLIFPEGTTTNGRSLIKFKTGAFSSGAPVQMLLFRHLGLNKVNTLTWTWNQWPNNAAFLFWVTLCQFNTRIEMEYLPVYKPNEAERNCQVSQIMFLQYPSLLEIWRLYAEKIRTLMAKQLNMPTTEHTLEDALKEKKKKRE